MASAPTTPYLRVDLDRLRRNVRSTAEWATTHRLALRPHVKTHKSPEIARLQLGQGAVGLTVATLGEAEVFVPARLRRPVRRLSGLRRRSGPPSGCAAWRERGRVAIGVDSVEGAARAGRLPRAVRRRGGRRGRLRPAPHRLPARGGGLGRGRRRPGRAHGARGVHLPRAQLRARRDGDRSGGRGPCAGHGARRPSSARGSRSPWSAAARRRASPISTPVCSPRPGRVSTSSATPSSGSSAACRRSRSR